MRLQWDAGALDWAASRIPEMHGQPFPDNGRGVAFVRDDGQVAGVVAFHDWQPAYRTIQVSAVSEDASWLLARKCWLQAFDYAYRTCDVDKIWTLTPHTNTRALRFIKALGFKPTAVLDHQFGPGKHAVFSHKFAWDHYEQAKSARCA